MDAVRRQELAEGQTLQVYRLVHVSEPADPALAEDMKSNAAKGKPPSGREVRQPAVHRGLSVYKSHNQAAALRRRIADRLIARGSNQPVRIGDYVARLVLSGPGIGYEDRDEPDGHLTIWGEPSRLAGAVADISPAEPDR